MTFAHLSLSILQSEGERDTKRGNGLILQIEYTKYHKKIRSKVSSIFTVRTTQNYLFIYVDDSQQVKGAQRKIYT